MTLLRLTQNLSVAKHPLRKRSKALRGAIRVGLEIWALTLSGVGPLLLYFIYFFSRAYSYAKEPVPGLKPKPDIVAEVALLFFVVVACWSFLKLVPHLLGWIRNTRMLAQRLTVRDAKSALNRDSRLPILYLRCFLDRYSGNDLLAQTESDENLIFPVIKELGPVIAIGQPGESLAPLGAARHYLEGDGDWQKIVTDYLSLSQLIVISPGFSDGLIWEASTALQSYPPEKIIVSLVSFQRDQKYSKTESDYELFREAIQKTAKIVLPENSDRALFIHFDSEGEPELVRPDTEVSSSMPATRYLASVYQLIIESVIPGFLNSVVGPEFAELDADEQSSEGIDRAVRDALRKLLLTKGLEVSSRMPATWYLARAYELTIVAAAFLIPVIAILRIVLKWTT